MSTARARRCPASLGKFSAQEIGVSATHGIGREHQRSPGKFLIFITSLRRSVSVRKFLCERGRHQSLLLHTRYKNAPLYMRQCPPDTSLDIAPFPLRGKTGGPLPPLAAFSCRSAPCTQPPGTRSLLPGAFRPPQGPSAVSSSSLSLCPKQESCPFLRDFSATGVTLQTESSYRCPEPGLCSPAPAVAQNGSPWRPALPPMPTAILGPFIVLLVEPWVKVAEPLPLKSGFVITFV